METLFKTVCIEKGATQLFEDVESNGLQKNMQTAINHIRAIVEVCPLNQARNKVKTWRKIAEVTMNAFA